jgi:hypothetical protein
MDTPARDRGLHVVQPFAPSPDIEVSERQQFRQRLEAAMEHLRCVAAELDGVLIDLQTGEPLEDD